MSSVSVVHLVWKPLGVEPFQRFLSSYQKNQGGLEHELLVVFNGFKDRSELDSYLELLDDTPYRPLFLPRSVQDIPAYYAAARNATSQFICLLNSYTVFLDESWLKKLYSVASRNNVGVVGATGSHQSLYSSIRESMMTPPRHFILRRWAASVRRRVALKRYESYFVPFPNPHVRSNAFMLTRELMLKLKYPPIRTKMEAMRFESGKDSLTRQIQAAGLKALVVGRNGTAYEPEQWFESHTFKSGAQANLLIADNRTEQFALADPETQAAMTKTAWGR